MSKLTIEYKWFLLEYFEPYSNNHHSQLQQCHGDETIIVLPGAMHPMIVTVDDNSRRWLF